jgi:hypothetical protein
MEGGCGITAEATAEAAGSSGVSDIRQAPRSCVAGPHCGNGVRRVKNGTGYREAAKVLKPNGDEYWRVVCVGTQTCAFKATKCAWNGCEVRCCPDNDICPQYMRAHYLHHMAAQKVDGLLERTHSLAVYWSRFFMVCSRSRELWIRLVLF